jgi:hypothetical protein
MGGVYDVNATKKKGIMGKQKMWRVYESRVKKASEVAER